MVGRDALASRFAVTARACLAAMIPAPRVMVRITTGSEWARVARSVAVSSGRAWGGGPSSGGLTSINSVFGTVPNQGDGMVFDYDATHKQLVVGRPASNIVSLLKLDVIFKSAFDAN